MTHSLGDQIPVPNWDPAFHFTENRETVNPRPLQEGAIASQELAWADAGFSSYNEGHHDDVNKHVWLAVAWGCDDGNSGECDESKAVKAALQDWSALHFDPSVADDVTELVYALERDWVGPLVGNPQINETYALMHNLNDMHAYAHQRGYRVAWLAFMSHHLYTHKHLIRLSDGRV